MDYDDNDFQSQNLHLAGEGSTKFPPVLRPYALPKFDFDDSLPGHLRFDSLVETEVFLGIESNEDNRWIEDFSRGGSGIEFSSSAAESCSIVRRNNVWSEATSSESVEMLLKSVGQEEIIPRQTIVKESDACDELGCLTKQMEPSLIHDDNILPKSGGITDLQSTLPQDEIPENLSGLKGDILVEGPHVEDTSQTQEDEFSVDGRSGELDPNAVSVKSSVPVIEESPFADGKSNDASRSGVDMLAEEYLDDKTQEDSSAPVMQVDNLVTCTHNKITSGDEMNDQDLLHPIDDISNMNSEELQTGIGEREEEFNVLSTEAKMNDQNLDENVVESGTFHLESPLGSLSKIDSVIEGNAIENCTSNVEEPSSMLHNNDADLHMVEQCREDVDSSIPAEPRKCDNVILLKDTKVGDPFKVNTHEVTPLAFKGDISNEGYAVQVSDPNAGICISMVPKMDAIVQLTHGQESNVEKDDLLQTSHQLDNEILVSKSEPPMPSMEENKVSEGEGNKNNNCHVGGISSVTLVCSSAELLGGTPETGTLKVVHDVSGAPSENLIAESTQTCEEDKFYGQGDVHKCDVNLSFSEKESTTLPSDSSNVDGVVGRSCIIDKGVEISSFREGSAGNESTVTKLQFDTTVGNESGLYKNSSNIDECLNLNICMKSTNFEVFFFFAASNDNLENAKVVSCDTVDGVLLPSSAITTDGVIHSQEVQMTASVGGLPHSDEKEPIATKTSSEAGISTLVESSEVETESGLISETEKDASHASAGKLLGETADLSLPMVETRGAESQAEAQTTFANEVYPVISDIAAKVGGGEKAAPKVAGEYL
jgi:hypothetical protein